jgi:hypothetical protein
MRAHAAFSLRTLLTATVFAGVSKLALFNTIGCNAYDRDPDDFMAFCNSPAQGDYDHAAYRYDLEPGMRAAVDSARVLFLGSSHIQVALSTAALRALERERPEVRPYLLGFGSFEQDRFSSAVLRKLNPSPRVIVVNADPFFADTESVDARNLEQNPGVGRANAVAKRAWHSFSAAVCPHANVVARLVCGNESTLYRSRRDGRWIFRSPWPRTGDLAAPRDTSIWPLVDQYAANARAFVERLPVPRRCVVVTHVPDGASSEATARAIADRIGATFLTVRLDSLGTYDGSHLDAVSSERWATAFFGALQPVFDRCF